MGVPILAIMAWTISFHEPDVSPALLSQSGAGETQGAFAALYKSTNGIDDCDPFKEFEMIQFADSVGRW